MISSDYGRMSAKMKIIIPMTGYGSRFVLAGYRDLKPLIKVQNIRILNWIIKGMYHKTDDILLICREDHLNNIDNMRETLHSISPRVKIYAIKNWVKKGPVFDVLKAAEEIDDEEECIVNYCDFYMDWDYSQFSREVRKRGCDGAIPCYTGFHPHLLIEDNYYASCLTDNCDDLIEIKEKFSFEADKMKAKHSPGVYYFRNGGILKKYCKMLVEKNETVNGEFYASLPYNYMVKDGLRVWVPVCVKKFCQWGTPKDMEEYLFYTEHTRRFT